MAVPAADGTTAVPGGYGWDGGTGTTWRTDRARDTTGILLTQRAMTSPEPPELFADFWRGAYARRGGSSSPLGGVRGLAAHPPLR